MLCLAMLDPQHAPPYFNVILGPCLEARKLTQHVGTPKCILIDFVPETSTQTETRKGTENGIPKKRWMWKAHLWQASPNRVDTGSGRLRQRAPAATLRTVLLAANRSNTPLYRPERRSLRPRRSP